MKLQGIMVFAESPEKLEAFYKEVFGKEAEWKADGYARFDLEGAWLTVRPHSEVHGSSHNPEQVMFNVETADVKAEFERIKDIGAKVIAKPYNPMDDGDGGLMYTFADPGGNYFQITAPMEMKKSN